MPNDRHLRETSETQMVDYGTRMRKRAERAEAQLAERTPRVVRGANVTVELIRGPIPDEDVHDECVLFIGDDFRNDIEIQGSLASIEAIGRAITSRVRGLAPHSGAAATHLLRPDGNTDASPGSSEGDTDLMDHATGEGRR